MMFLTVCVTVLAEREREKKQKQTTVLGLFCRTESGPETWKTIFSGLVNMKLTDCDSVSVT